MRNYRSDIICLGTWVTLSLLVAACGGGGSSDPASVTPPNGEVPVPPSGSLSIDGDPATSVTQGLTYSFIPSVSDPEDPTLEFSVTGLPSWADFNTSNGQ